MVLTCTEAARAIRRAGELYKQIESGQGNRTDLLQDGTVPKLTRTEARWLAVVGCDPRHGGGADELIREKR